ncbi:MAG: ribonuclease Y [Acidobacteriota bacterium]
MKSTWLLLLSGAILLVLVVVDGLLRRLIWNHRVARARARARRLCAQAEETARTRLKEAELSAREQIAGAEAHIALRDQEQKTKFQKTDDRLRAAQAQVDRQRNQLESRKAEVAHQEAELGGRLERLRAKEKTLLQREDEVRLQMEKVAGLTREEARNQVVSQVIETARDEASRDVSRLLHEAKKEMEGKLRGLIAQTLQRVRTPGLVESTVSVVRLPSDDMKGRIIGREGRNIRSIEMTTGIDLIVDDTPQTILISCFDPMRREIARIAIERLVEDGRIHPARIEELVEKTRADMDQIILETGEAAMFDLGLQDIHPRLLRLLGRLKYHTSHGQNLLQHCRETADLAGLLAVELGISPEIPRRAGLLHEIAQAADDQAQAPSILSSAEMAVRQGEGKDLQQAIAAAHPDVTPRRLDGALVRLACRLSRSRTGARKDNLEVFISRMRRMEALATSYPGVRAAHAVRAGKQLRIWVETQEVSDQQTIALTKEITTRIEKEVDHPAEIRVSILRELRAVGYAL